MTPAPGAITHCFFCPARGPVSHDPAIRPHVRAVRGRGIWQAGFPVGWFASVAATAAILVTRGRRGPIVLPAKPRFR